MKQFLKFGGLSFILWTSLSAALKAEVPAPATASVPCQKAATAVSQAVAIEQARDVLLRQRIGDPLVRYTAIDGLITGLQAQDDRVRSQAQDLARDWVQALGSEAEEVMSFSRASLRETRVQEYLRDAMSARREAELSAEEAEMDRYMQIARRNEATASILRLTPYVVSAVRQDFDPQAIQQINLRQILR